MFSDNYIVPEITWLFLFTQLLGLNPVYAFFRVSDRASGPLDGVDHWLTAFDSGSRLFPGFRPELVVHSTEWATGS